MHRFRSNRSKPRLAKQTELPRTVRAIIYTDILPLQRGLVRPSRKSDGQLDMVSSILRRLVYIRDNTVEP